MSLAGVEASLTLAASAAKHVGWWIDWQTRSHPGRAFHEDAGDTRTEAVLRLLRAA